MILGRVVVRLIRVLVKPSAAFKQTSRRQRPFFEQASRRCGTKAYNCLLRSFALVTRRVRCAPPAPAAEIW